MYKNYKKTRYDICYTTINDVNQSFLVVNKYK